MQICYAGQREMVNNNVTINQPYAGTINVYNWYK